MTHRADLSTSSFKESSESTKEMKKNRSSTYAKPNSYVGVNGQTDWSSFLVVLIS